MTLESDKFDPQDILEALKKDAVLLLGGYGSMAHRLAGREFETFIEEHVRTALMQAFRRAEGIYVYRMADAAEASSRNLLEGVLAGAELGKRDALAEAANKGKTKKKGLNGRG